MGEPSVSRPLYNRVFLLCFCFALPGFTDSLPLFDPPPPQSRVICFRTQGTDIREKRPQGILHGGGIAGRRVIKSVFVLKKKSKRQFL